MLETREQPRANLALLRLRRRTVNRLARVGSVAVLVILGLLTFVQVRDGITPEVALWRDFGQDYLLARAFLDGADPYVPVRVLAERYLEPTGFLARETPTPHPPSVALLVLPLTPLGSTNAVRAWFVLQVAALLLGIFLTLRSLGARSRAVDRCRATDQRLVRHRGR